MSDAIKSAAGYSSQYWNNLPFEQQAKVFKALDTLVKDDPELPDLLVKLAALKENKPLTYKMAKAKLKNY